MFKYALTMFIRVIEKYMFKKKKTNKNTSVDVDQIEVNA